MKDLIEALTIFAKYKDEYAPIHCEHEILMVPGISDTDLSDEDRKRVEELGFDWDSDFDCWTSLRFGSA